MGTIGHRTLLYELSYWQIRAAYRGHYRQQRVYYETARMLGLWTVSCQRSKEEPTLKPEDLAKFPWERKPRTAPSPENIEYCQQLIDEANNEQPD